jgi:hypothetical protein
VARCQSEREGEVEGVAQGQGQGAEVWVSAGNYVEEY